MSPERQPQVCEDQVFSASSLKNLRSHIYPMTRAHIEDQSSLFIIIDRENMSLVRKSQTIKSSQGDYAWFALKDGSVNPYIRLRVRDAGVDKFKLKTGSVLHAQAELDQYHYSGFTLREVLVK